MMQGYGEYKDSGANLVELELPTQWRSQKCRFVFKFNKGLTITKENLQETGIPCVNYGEIHSKYGFEVDPSKHDLKCVDPSYLKTDMASLLQEGDFIFADTSEDIEGSGNFTCLNGNKPTFSGYHTLIARAMGASSNRFLAYVLDSSSFREQVRKSVKGVKVYSITQAILKEMVVWFPTSDEQLTIANFLDEKTAKIDDLLRIKRRQIELLTERKKVLIQQAVTKGLNPDAKMKYSGIDWIGDIPAHWDVVKFKNLFTQSRLPICPDDQVVTSFRDGQVTLRSNRRLHGFTEAILEGGYQGIREGQLTLNSMDAFEGAIGVSESNGKCTPEYVICDPKSDDAVPQYFAFQLREMALAKYIQVICNAVRQRAVRIRYNNLASRYIAVPKKDEQEEIIAFVEAESIKTDGAINIIEKQISKLNEYKTTLINAAVTGKIKVA